MLILSSATFHPHYVFIFPSAFGVIGILSSAIFLPHFAIHNFSSLFCSPHFSICIQWHPHFIIRNFPSVFFHPYPGSSVFCHPHYSIHIIPSYFSVLFLSFLLGHPQFPVRISPSSFWHHHLVILIFPSYHFSIFPSAIRHQMRGCFLYFICIMMKWLTIDYVDYKGFSSVPPPSEGKALETRLLAVCMSLVLSLFKFLYSEVLLAN